MTEHGVVDVGWQRKDKRIDFSFRIPEGISAEVHIPRVAAGNTIVVNGVSVPYSDTAGYLVIELGSGEFRGTVY